MKLAVVHVAQLDRPLIRHTYFTIKDHSECGIVRADQATHLGILAAEGQDWDLCGFAAAHLSDAF